MKYSDQFADWLVEEGYTHCFFVAGGNIMHLLNSVRTRMKCIPFVNEVGAAIAAEYFTVASSEKGEKAFVLVTAGPGFTNTITAIASAWTESRELLVVGGQVKSSDLAAGLLRQRGIQEINGIEIAKSITKAVLQISEPVKKHLILDVLDQGTSGRKGPVFIEFTLDAQGAPAIDEDNSEIRKILESRVATDKEISLASALIQESSRPLFLLGSGVTRQTARRLAQKLEKFGVPVMLTWNGADRLPEDHVLNMGRPNTWGQRAANVLLQQSDLLLAIGTRLGMQQTGFAWDEFVPRGKVVQVDIDRAELEKPHPSKSLIIEADANDFLERILELSSTKKEWAEWVDFNNHVKNRLPLSENENITGEEFINPFDLMLEISEIAQDNDKIIPCSSGGSFTVAMQAFQLKGMQQMITNKGMASMGYGLSGSIGASLANASANTYLFEGDGGFAQNLQELGTVRANNLNLKMFIFANRGYASIRMTQRNYFDGAWVGCDEETGLGLPNWRQLSGAYSIPFVELAVESGLRAEQLSSLAKVPGPVFIVVPIDPEQTYFPKISSRVIDNGQMKSNPLHLMDPPLAPEISKEVLKYI